MADCFVLLSIRRSLPSAVSWVVLLEPTSMVWPMRLMLISLSDVETTTWLSPTPAFMTPCAHPAGAPLMCMRFQVSSPPSSACAARGEASRATTIKRGRWRVRMPGMVRKEQAGAPGPTS